MKDFDLRKYMSNNPLHQSNIGGFSITELQQTSKSDFEIGLAILSEMGYDVSKESLNEIKFPSWISNFGTNIKSKVLDKFDKIKSSKDPNKEAREKMQAALDQLKLEYSEEWEEIKDMDLTDLKNISKIVPQKNLQEDQDDDISDKTLKKSRNKRRLGGLAMLLGYIGILASGMNISADEVKKYAEQTDAKAKTELVQDVKTEPIIDPNTDYVLGGDNVYKTQHQKGESNIDDKPEEAREIIKALGIDKMPKGTKADVGVKGKISSTLGDQDDNPNGPKKKGLGKERLDQGKEVLDIAKEIAADEYDVDINIVDQGTNVKDALADKSNEVDANSKEALSAQTTDYTLLDVDAGDTDVVPDDTGDTEANQAIKTPPKDIIAFLSKKPEFDKSKYEIIFMHILPFIIGNGEDGITKSNPTFEKILKTLNFSDKSETLNDTFIAKRLGRPEIKNKKTGKISKAIPSELKGRLKDAKGDEKKDIEDTIKVLTWLRNTKKSPKTIGDFLNKLNPNLEVGEKRKFGKQDTRLKKGEKVTPSKSRKDFRGPGAKPEKLNNPMNIMPMEYLIKEIRSSLLMEFNSSQLPDYNESAAKKNIGHLLPIYTTSFKGKATDEDDGTITYNIDAIYDFDEKGEPSIKPEYAKSQEYFQKYFKIFPQHKEQAKQTKEKESEKIDTKTTTTTTTTTSKTTDVKVDDTIELDPKASDKKKTSKDSSSISNDLEKTSKLGKDLDNIKKSISGKDKKSSKDDSETLARKTDYKKGEDAVDPSSKNFGDELGKHKQIVTALNLINTTDEFTNLLVGIMMFISPTLLKNPAKLKATLIRTATTSYDPEGVPDSERVKKEKASKDSKQLKPDLKENSFLFSLFEEVEKETSEVFKDVDKVVDLIKNKPTLLNRLKLIKSWKSLEELILAELIEKLNDKFVTKDQNVKTAIKAAAAVAGTGIIKPYDKTKSSSTDKVTKSQAKSSPSKVTKSQAKDFGEKLKTEQIKSLIKNIITEGLTPSQASKVKDKYKQIYSGMLKGDKKKLLKYIDDKFGRPNPDAMAMGRAVNLSKKEEDENVEEAKTEKQRKYMCVMAQQGAKRPKGLSKAQAKEMCADTGLSKSKQEEQKLSEIDDIMDKSKDYKPIVGGDNSKLKKWIDMTDKEKKKLYPKFHKKKFHQLLKHQRDQIDVSPKKLKETGKNKSEENMDEYKDKNRLTELIKTALKGPLNEATDLVDRDGYQFTRFSMGEEGPGLQITSQGGNYITIPGSKLGVFASALTDAIRVFDDSKRQLPVSEKKTDQDKDGDNDFDDVKIARMKASGMSHDDAVKKVKGKVDEASKAGKLRIPKDIEKLLQDAHGDFVAGKIDGIELGERLDQILNNPQGPDPNVKGYYGPTNFTVDMDLDEDKDFIQKAIKRPGALRKKLGVKKGEDIPKGKINKAIAKLKKKDKDKEKEGTQLGAADERELRQLNLAKTLSKLKEETLSERIFKELRK